MIPYCVITDDTEVARRVMNGERLEQPDNCPDPVYAMMQNCWNSAPKDRPSMTDLQTALQEAFAEESLELYIMCASVISTRVPFFLVL